MKYMGGKSRISKEIVPIIQNVINKRSITNYIEPFCGGCSIVEKIACENRTASDINPYLIGLFQHLQSGGDFLTLEEISGQILDKAPSGENQIIEVRIEKPLNGVIYQYGNCQDNKWHKHGETRGYA